MKEGEFNREFTSGVTEDDHYIINMDAYIEHDIPTAWKLSKLWQRLDETADIDFDDYKTGWLTVKWEGNVFYPTIHDYRVRGSCPVRLYEIVWG